MFSADGGWSEWEAHPCDAPCGPSTFNRARECQTRNGGSTCVGESLVKEPCNDFNCD